MKYFSIVSKSADPYYNLAEEEYLESYVSDDINILFLWQNENTIVVGRNQDVSTECRIGEFLESRGKIARRRSGGGAVYHDLGNLNFSLIGLRGNIHPMLYRDTVIELISSFGVKPEYTGRNDILLSGRKFSGNAVYDNGHIICQHGTIMVDCDIERMTRFLTPNEGKLKKHGVKSVSSRVINLMELLPGITVGSVADRMQRLLDSTPLLLERDDEIKILMQKYQNEKWIYGGVI